MNKTTYDRGIERGIEKGMEKGFERGIEKGMEKGAEERRQMHQALIEMTETFLRQRFGNLPNKVMSQLKELSPEQLKMTALNASTAHNLAELGLQDD